MIEGIKVTGIVLHPGQVRIVREMERTDAMYHTVCCPRQFGKSTLLLQLILRDALNNRGARLMFTSPTYGQSSKVYRELIDGLRGSGVVKKYNAAENSLSLVNESEIYFKSVQQPDNLRGYAIDYLYLDEAAKYPDTVFDAVLRPMLLVRGKRCVILSTPRGKSNWFYKLYSFGNDPDKPRYASYRGSSDENPYASVTEIEDARKSLPPALFRQEYLAEFIEGGGEVFENFAKCATVSKWRESAPVCYAGIDIGRQDDWTVLTVMDDAGTVLFVYRKRHAEWQTIISECARVLNKYKPRCTLVEANGVGDVFYSMIKREHSNVDAWITSNSSKQTIVEELILAFQAGEIAIPTAALSPEMHAELSDFSFTYSKAARTVSYGAFSGHDDTVLSLALANHARKTGARKGLYCVQ